MHTDLYKTVMIGHGFLAHKRESLRYRPAIRLTRASARVCAASADALRFIASERRATSGLGITILNE